VSDGLFTLFDTALGCCGLVWRGGVVIGAQLPEAEPDAARARLLRRFPEARASEPPAALMPALAGIRALMAGEPIDLGFIPVDLGGASDFQRRVWAVTSAIRHGETLTYGEVAARIGEPEAARAVGVALGQNPVPPIVPCHRVLAAGGGAGGFSATGAVATKMRLLSVEKARIGGQPGLFEALPFAAAPRRR